jgi:hypothetical protein
MSSENFFPCDIVWQKEIAKTERKEKKKKKHRPQQGTLTEGERKLSSADLFIRLACYVEKINKIFNI